MLSKLPKFSKSHLITGLIFFAAFIFRSVFALTQTSHFFAMHILYLLIGFVPFTLLIMSKLSDDFKKNVKAVDVAALIVIMYALVVVLNDTVLRYSVLTAIGIASASLLLCQNIYALPVVAVFNLVSVFFPQLGCSVTVSIPAVICYSMVYFSYIFEKSKSVSKKKAKKAETNITVPDYKKEKIIFAVSEVILLAALAVMAYYRRYTIYIYNFTVNMEYIIPALIPAICFIIFAVLILKNKKPFVGVVGYIIAIAAMPLAHLCGDYSVSATGTLIAFTLLLSLCDTKLASGKHVDGAFGNVVAKFSNKNKTAEE